MPTWRLPQRLQWRSPSFVHLLNSLAQRLDRPHRDAPARSGRCRYRGRAQMCGVRDEPLLRPVRREHVPTAVG